MIQPEQMASLKKAFTVRGTWEPRTEAEDLGSEEAMASTVSSKLEKEAGCGGSHISTVIPVLKGLGKRIILSNFIVSSRTALARE